MQIATILPTAHLNLEDGNPYHLCLAHQIKGNLTYAFFFRKQVKDGAFVICDNGAAESGTPMDIESLLPIAEMIGCRELVLPDTIYDAKVTLRTSYKALKKAREEMPALNLMAVPHGRSAEEWVSCLKEMMTWDINTIGISKFIAPKLFASRAEALEVLHYYYRDIEVHLLGYTGVWSEVQEIERSFPGRVRGIDSSLPTLYAQIGQELRGERPNIKLNLDAELDEELLKENIRRWKELCST